MSDIPNAAPAGDGEQTDSTQDQDTGPISQTAAADMLAEFDFDGEDEAAADLAGETEDATEASEDAPEAEAEAATEDEGQETPEGEESPDTEQKPDADEEDQLAHGNMRTRLRDGTVTTVGELKKLADEAREYRAKAPQIAAQEKQLSERAAQIAQQEQFVNQILPQAAAILQAYIPPAPDMELVDRNSPKYDPVLYVELEAAHNAGIARLRQFQDAHAAQQSKAEQQANAKAEAERQERIERGRKVLLEKIPDIANPEKAAAIQQGFVDRAKEFGFVQAEIDAVDDPRIIHLIHTMSLYKSKAEAYDKLMAQKRVVQEKVAAAPPVAKPGPRVSAEATRDKQNNELIQRAMKSGRLRDAEAALATFD